MQFLIAVMLMLAVALTQAGDNKNTETPTASNQPSSFVEVFPTPPEFIIEEESFSESPGETFDDTDTQGRSAAPVPEPATMLLLGPAMVALAMVKKKRS